MSVSVKLVDRCGDLKRRLVDFGLSHRFSSTFKEAIAETYGGDSIVEDDEGGLANFIDSFLLQYPQPDGRPVLDHFVDAANDLTDEDRAILLGWHDVVDGTFEITRHDHGAVVAVNVLDEMTYRIHASAGYHTLRPMRPGGFIIARVVPLQDEWLLSGAQAAFPRSARSTLLGIAAELALALPEAVFRNPEKLARGWELQRQQRRDFIAFFGTDEVIMPGSDFAKRIREFWAWYAEHAAEAARDSAGEGGGRSIQPPWRSRSLDGLEPPAALADANTVGVICDEVDGISYLVEYGTVVETFANPQVASDPTHRKCTLTYLRDDTIQPTVLRRLAERDPAAASAVFQRLLNKPTFSWERDGDALLRRHKAWYFATPRLPSIVPLSEDLAEHLRR